MKCPNCRSKLVDYYAKSSSTESVYRCASCKAVIEPAYGPMTIVLVFFLGVPLVEIAMHWLAGLVLLDLVRDSVFLGIPAERLLSVSVSIVVMMLVLTRLNRAVVVSVEGASE